MTGIQIIRTLRADYGLGDETILAVLADYVDQYCIPEHVLEICLDRANPKGVGPDRSMMCAVCGKHVDECQCECCPNCDNVLEECTCEDAG